MTNAEKIRSMTNQELRVFINWLISCDSCPFFRDCVKTSYSCQNFIETWLKSEVEQ